VVILHAPADEVLNPAHEETIIKNENDE